MPEITVLNVVKLFGEKHVVFVLNVCSLDFSAIGLYVLLDCTLNYSDYRCSKRLTTINAVNSDIRNLIYTVICLKLI